MIHIFFTALLLLIQSGFLHTQTLSGYKRLTDEEQREIRKEKIDRFLFSPDWLSTPQKEIILIPSDR